MSNIPMLAKDDAYLDSFNDFDIVQRGPPSAKSSSAPPSLFAPTVSDGTGLAPQYALAADTNDGGNDSETRRSWAHYYVGAPGTLLGAVFGLVLGLVLAMPSVKNELKQFEYTEKLIVRWGALYFRAVSCLLVPTVFVSLAKSIADIVFNPRMTRMGWRILMYSFGTTLLAVAQAMAWGYFLSDKYDGAEYKFKYSGFSVTCPNKQTLLKAPNGTLSCGPLPPRQYRTMVFPLYDTTKQLSIAPDIRKLVYYESTTKEILHGILLLTPGNFFGAWYRNEVMSVVVFAIVFGLAVGGAQVKPLLQLLEGLETILNTMTSAVVKMAPIALISLIAGPVYAGTHVLTIDEDLGRILWYLLTFIVASAVHAIVVLPVLFLLRTQQSPWRFLHPERRVAARTRSASHKSLPVVSRCFTRAPGVHANARSRFAMATGMVFTKNGGALYITLSLFWVLHNSGMMRYISSTKMGLVAFSSVVGTYAVAPVRTGGVAVVLSLFTMITGLSIPYSMHFLLVAECFLDPIATVVNTWSNAIIARI
ncbi:dicarboxylate/amino acid:cation (Na or H) symporter (DAACS) family protein, partial [Achlya hypogyna]